MIKEKLYIYVDGERRRLDLSVPSGITLTYVSNLFGDLTKINSSYSYTFKLPQTVNNRIVLELLDDVRSNSKFRRLKVPAEYYRDGVSLFKNANMYVFKMTQEYYECVFTWGGCSGLADMQDKGISINQLGNYLKDGYDYEYISKDGSVKERDIIIPSGTTQFTPFKDVSPNLPCVNTIHTPGVDIYLKSPRGLPYIIGEQGEMCTYTLYSGDTWHHTEPSHPTENVWWECATPPTVPMDFIVQTIARQYNLNIDFRGGLYDKMCVPLIKKAPTDGLMRQSFIRLKDFKHLGGIYTDFSSVEVYNATSKGAISTRVLSADDSKAVSVEYSYPGNSLGSDIRCKFVLDGVVTIYTNDLYGGNLDDSSYPKLKVQVPTKGWSGSTIPSDVEWADALEVKAMGLDPIQTKGYRYRFDFSEEGGNGVAESDMLFYRVFRIVLTDANGGAMSIVDMESDFRIFLKMDEKSDGFYTNLFANLPDISCIDFIKSLAYMLGGFPMGDADGNIRLEHYRKIAENYLNGKVIDWSKYELINNDSQELIVDYSQPDGTTIAQRNYYLMKNDELDEFGDPIRDAYGDDWYKHSYACIYVDNPVLDKFTTVITLPFYGAYIRNGKKPYFPTGNTQDYITLDDKPIAEPGDVTNVLMYATPREAKPMVGLYRGVDVDIRWTEWEKNEDQTGASFDDSYYVYYPYPDQLTTIDIWQLPSDPTSSSLYGVLAEIMKNPVTVEVYLKLTMIELRDIDYTVPVYLSKYDSYFVVSKIEVTTDNISKATLLKIPNGLDWKKLASDDTEQVPSTPDTPTPDNPDPDTPTPNDPKPAKLFNAVVTFYGYGDVVVEEDGHLTNERGIVQYLQDIADTTVNIVPETDEIEVAVYLSPVSTKPLIGTLTGTLKGNNGVPQEASVVKNSAVYFYNVPLQTDQYELEVTLTTVNNETQTKTINFNLNRL